jgi:hypothetical protein
MSTRRSIRPQGRCVFCGGTGLSKEHVIAEWLKRTLPDVPDHTLIGLNFTFDPAATFVHDSTRSRQGGFHQRKVRNVCTKCNNGWMSGIVERAKDFVEPLVRNQAVHLHQQGQRDLATWIALTCIMAEFTGEGTAAIPPEDRQFIRSNEEPPPHWIIYVGRYGGTTWATRGLRYRHHSGIMADPRFPDWS